MAIPLNPLKPFVQTTIRITSINNADDKDRFDFIDVVKSCYETSSMVRYYIGDPENITLDNRKLWPLRHRAYSELNM